MSNNNNNNAYNEEINELFDSDKLFEKTSSSDSLDESLFHHKKKPEETTTSSSSKEVGESTGGEDTTLKKPKKKTKKLKLSHKWIVWGEKFVENWTVDSQDINKLGTFGTIQDFWNLYKALPDIELLGTKNSYHLMKITKDGYTIKPAWEDKENAKGGSLNFRAGIKDAKKVWEELLLAVIGEQFTDDLGENDEICGVTVSRRPLDFVFQLWNKKVTKTEQYPDGMYLFEKVKKIVSQIESDPPIELKTPFYREHSTKETTSATPKK